MKRVAMKIAYLGSGFSGSQAQPGLRTVTSQVLDDIGKVLGDENPGLEFSSRTDKGVNALGNAISFYSEMDDLYVLTKALNSVSDGVFYRSYCEVGEDFNVRHASRRVYRYVLDPRGLDMQKARGCCRLFEGEHDFARFCRYDGKPTTLTLDRVELLEEGGMAILEFQARYYLWNMIRRISSSVDRVGKGKASMDDVKAALEGQEFSFGVGRADALTLVDVQYDFLRFLEADPRGIEGRRCEHIMEERLRLGFYESLRRRTGW
ncbi:MAG: tRNA pseudouridine(38-40) synthase TruA [Candidatus Methanomethylophilaceae archaeon]|nr:tRNA pseudouridine(38-40) synthase TruA [Candidatus Methanomethylophilaceae archaeon]